MSNDFVDESDNEESGFSNEDIQNLFARLAASGNLHIRHVDGDSEDDDDDEDFDDDDVEGDDEDADEEEGQQFSMGFGLGSDGSVTRLEDDGRGGLSFSFTLDEDGNEVPEFRCPSCNIKNCEEIDGDSDTHKCDACGYEFVPEIYKALDTASAYIDRAEQNWLEGRFTRVIKDSSAAITLDPNIRKAYLQRGKAYMEKENLELAERDFSEAIRISPDYDVAYFERGKTRMILQNFDEAIADFTKSIGFDPDFAETYRLRAVGYVNQERYEESIKDFSKAIKCDPNYGRPWFERGYSYSLLNEDEKAIQDYTEAIRLDPDFLDSYVRRAEVQDKLGRFPAAIEDYQAYLQKVGKGKSADEITERLKKIQIKLDSAQHIVRGFELFNAKDLKGALKESELAKNLTPDDEKPYSLAFLVYNDQQNWDNAISNLLEVIRIKPNDAVAHTNLAVCKSKKGDQDGAIAELIKATQLDPKYAEAHLNLGAAYLMTGKYDLAKECLTKSINLDPSVPVAYLHRASVKEKLKDYPAAIPDFEKYYALGGSPEVPDLAPLREHIEYLKKEYGVADIRQDESRYSIILKPAKNYVFDQKREVIMMLRKFFSLGLVEAKKISEKESVIGTDMTFDEASLMVRDFKEIGADAQLVNSKLPLDIEIQREVDRLKQLAEQELREQEEQNRKQAQYEERKQKLQKEINERNTRLEQLKRETAQQIDGLRRDREKLGFLAMSKKKEIDQKIVSLENQLSDFSATLESLRKQLSELKP